MKNDYDRTRKSLILRLQETRVGVSWNEFYEIYERMIYAICLKRGLSDADAKDVRQKAAIRIHGRIGTFDPQRGSFRSWIGVIVRSSVSDHFRGKNRPLPTKEPVGDEDPLANLLPEDDLSKKTLTDDFNRMWDEEWRNHLEQAASIKLLQKYSSRDCQIFDCFVKKDFNAKELAKHYGLTENNVNQIVNRTKKTFQEECERLLAEG